MKLIFDTIDKTFYKTEHKLAYEYQFRQIFDFIEKYQTLNNVINLSNNEYNYNYKLEIDKIYKDISYSKNLNTSLNDAKFHNQLIFKKLAGYEIKKNIDLYCLSSGSIALH
jgi:hypothetical protein